jgi:hypothetical protein
MKQVLIEKISKNKELPKTMLEVYRSLGYMNFKFGCSNHHINDFTNIRLIAKSLNGSDWNPEINEKLKLFYPYFEWDNSSQKFVYSHYYKDDKNYSANLFFGFKSIYLAEYAGITFIEQYNKWLIKPKKDSKIFDLDIELHYSEIKTMSDVYKKNNITKFETLPNTKERCYEDLILITKALNGNWEFDFSSNTLKWVPYFKISKQITCNYISYNLNNIQPDVGYNLYFKNLEIAEYAGKTFIEQYEKLMRF